MTAKSQAKVIGTGKAITVKPYGIGYIDSSGNFYEAHELQFICVLE